MDAQGNVYVAEGRNRELQEIRQETRVARGGRQGNGSEGLRIVPRLSRAFPASISTAKIGTRRSRTMVGGGAPLKKEEIQVVVDYLAKNFKGVATPGRGGSRQRAGYHYGVGRAHAQLDAVRYLPQQTERLHLVHGAFANVMGRFDPKTQKFEEYHLRPGTNPSSLLEFPEGNFNGVIFFAPQTGGVIGEFHPVDGPYPTWSEGDVIEHPIPGPKFQLHDIAVGPNAGYLVHRSSGNAATLSRGKQDWAVRSIQPAG